MSNQKKAAKAILISDKMDFKIKIVTGNEERHFLMINPSRRPSDIVTLQHSQKVNEPKT